jgi:hypothetical protein
MKIKKLAGLCVLMLMLSFSAFSQTITFCSDYSSNGTPKETGTDWIIKSTGGYVTMIYQQSSKFPEIGNMWLYVDIMQDGEYKAYKTVEITPSKYQNWIVYTIWIDKAGSFKVTMKDLYSDLATAYMNVKIKDQTSSNTNYSSNDYSGSKVIFCEDVDANGEATYPDNVFNIDPAGSYVQVLVKNNNKPFNTTAFNVKVYKMKKGDYEFVETKNVTGIKNTWVFAYFKYTFYDTGDYKFDVYSAENNLINTGYVTIKYK